MNDHPAPSCKICYKALPETWHGIDICPMCDYLSQAKAAQAPHHARVSYRSPLARLDRNPDGHNR